MQIEIVDNFYNTENLNNVIQKSDDYKWIFGRGDLNDDIYWTVQVYGTLFNTKIKYKNFEFKEVERLWEEFSNQFKVPKENLKQCYLNGITYGLEAYPHVDFDETGSTTVIIYLCPNWNSYWGGETSFFNMNCVKNNPSHEVYYNHEIIKTVLPKYNRMVMFDGNITHAVRTISKSFKGLRKTLMFKIENISLQQMMENYKCN